MNIVPETPLYEALSAPDYLTFRGGRIVDIVGVTSSILVTPTILFPYISNTCAAFGRRFTYFPLGSLNLRHS